MAAAIDHLILPVNDPVATVAFYTEIVGFTHEGESPPFSIVRVSPEFTLQIAPFGTEGGVHLAFALPKPDFDAAFQRVRAAGIEFGDSYLTVGNGRGPGDEDGARGAGKALYVFDPNRHLIELRYYENAGKGRTGVP